MKTFLKFEEFINEAKTPNEKQIVNAIKKNRNISFWVDSTKKEHISFEAYDKEWTAKKIKIVMDDLYKLYKSGNPIINAHTIIKASGFNFDGLDETDILLFGEKGQVYEN